MTPEEKAMVTLDEIEKGEKSVSFNELLELAMYLAQSSSDKRLSLFLLGLTRKLIVLNHNHKETRQMAWDCRTWHK